MSEETENQKPVYVSETLHRELKAEAARLGVSLREVVEQAIRRGRGQESEGVAA